MTNKYLKAVKSYFLILLIGLLSSQCSRNDAGKSTSGEQESANLDQKKDYSDWKNDKLTLFVHFGAYSQLEGQWQGRLTDGPAEDIWANSGIFLNQYERMVREFDPQKWDAQNIINIARDTGYKTIIFTAKHHDGFCLFGTKTTKFNSVDFTPLNADLIAEMASACEKANMNFGISFSLTDWHLPVAFPMTDKQNNPVSPEHHQTNLAQLEELMSNYGPISEVYFHSGINTTKQSRELKKLIKEKQPECLISNGIGNDLGDFIATEFNQSHEHSLSVPWIKRSSAFKNTLSFHKQTDNQDALSIARKKVREMVQVISEGGNFAFNLGPKADGSFSETEEEIIKHMGRWIKVNREAIFGTRQNPLHRSNPNWHLTFKNNKLYVFVLRVPTNKAIRLSGFENKIESVQFLGSGIEPDFRQMGQTHIIEWTSPAMADPMQLPVLEISFENPVSELTESPISVSSADTIILDIDNAIKHRSISGMDKSTNIPSIVGLKWNVISDENLRGKLHFNPQSQGKELTLKTATDTIKLKLNGKPEKLIRSENDTIETGKIFQTPPFYGCLKKVHINPNGNNRLQMSNSPWMGINPDKKDPFLPLPLNAKYYYLEIESENAQKFCYEIRANDGLQVWLNKKQIILTVNSRPGEPMARELILDLKKGKNILLVKNYNRLGNQNYFKLSPKPDAMWMTQSVSIPADAEFIELDKGTDELRHEDIGLTDFSITLTSKN
ncbi:alpha-L-fucosidase [Marinilabilia rubra]|uniref:alpha-L-fucosidase n=1 Tax=Marinilabilia rubra TaxID=2162893 RepID=A0A2U2BDZ2_9BACT|nr:alpha-L-fucosidase [Marinilabilia rubra]PWE01253.1 alpha-L-fucosidase [Marinilabilia rubra]